VGDCRGVGGVEGDGGMRYLFVPLGGLVTILGGGTPSRKNDAYWGGSIPWATVKDLKGTSLSGTQETITPEGLRDSASNLIPAGSVIVATRMGLGKVAINTIDVTINQDLKAFLCSADIEPRYLLYFLLVNASHLDSMGKGATVKGITLDVLKDLLVPLPPLPEQKRIAAILDKADSIRRKRQEAVRQTEELLRSAFLEMFGDQAENPKGWEVVKLKKCCKRITDGTHQPPGFTNVGVPFLFVSNVINGQLDFTSTKFISHDTFQELNRRCPVEIGDVLYTTVGSYGNAAIVETGRPFSFQRHIAHIKPDNNKVVEKYLVATMQSPMVKKQADMQARGVAQKTLNLSELKDFEIYLPPRKIQQQFVEQRERILKITRHYQDCLYQTDTLFNSLLQRAFMGEL